MNLVVPANKYAYIGDIKYAPSDVLPLPEKFNAIHPCDFQDYVDELPDRAYYNNDLWLDYFPPKQVIACSEHGQAVLSLYPEFAVIKNEFSTGEIYTFIPKNWPTKEFFASLERTTPHE